MARHPMTVATCILLPIAFTAKADYMGSEAIGLFGTLLNQNDLTVKDPNSGLSLGPQACVPTSVAQGLSYLENYQLSVGNADPFTVSPDNNTAVKNLAAVMSTRNDPTVTPKLLGTFYPNRVNGTTTYLSPGGANPSTAYVVAGQYLSGYSAAASIGPTKQNTMQANSVASLLSSGLNAHDGVELAILWGSLDTTTDVYRQSMGGHFVTLQSIDYNAAKGTGTIDFIDPNDATLYDGTLTKTTGGNLYITYGAPVPADDGEEEEDVAGGWEDGGVPPGQLGGIISNDLLEAVPDGGLTAGWLGVSALSLLALRSRYSFKASTRPGGLCA